MKLEFVNPFNQKIHYENSSDRINVLHPFITVLSALTHFALIFLFLFTGVKEMMYFNMFISLPLLILSYILKNYNSLLLAWIIFYFEIAFHAIAALYFIGWESGFQFYLLNCIILIHLGYGWKSWFRWSIYFFFLLCFVLSFVYLKTTPVYQLSNTLLDFLYIFNIFVFTLLANVLIFFFVSLVINFEKKIKQTNERLNQKNKLINEQKDEIEAQRDLLSDQKDEIEKTHLEVTDSIDYAVRIQKSILPAIESLHENIKGLFVFFKPKYKVSGDFYWWANLENQTIITAADCTGHGVPGAFMSMLGISYLREIVLKEYMTQPDVILRKLRKEIVKSLKQKGETGEQKDGMDLGLVCINHESNRVQFAGANNPVYVVTKNKLDINNAEVKMFSLGNMESKLYEIKPDKMPIGIYQKMDKFTLHEFQIQEGDTIYLFSDGFADQFGGPEGKKFKYSPFKKILLENSHRPIFEQKEILDRTFREWKGDQEQVDDVVVLGFKI